MLAAVPSGENFIINHSNAVKNTGNAKTAYHELVLATIFLVIVIINAKINDRAVVKIIAGTNVTTVTK
jgi:hypothetical protein